MWEPIYKNKKLKSLFYNANFCYFFSAHDTLNSNDPDAPEETRRFGNQEAEDNTKTLEEYLADRKSKPLQLPEVRKANEGSNDSQWKESVVLEKEEDSYFVGKV
jgi:plasminogen activator inhibitor 1 RNA-binding protein